jgi:hypothetical protein
MEKEQMTARLLAEIRTNREEMLAKIDAYKKIWMPKWKPINE